MDDAVLIEAALSGDERAFTELYQRHRDAAFRFAYRLRGSVEDAEDLTQQCFMELLRVRFDPGRGTVLRTYLLAIVRNLALKQLRRPEHELVSEDVAADGKGALDRAIARETAQAVREAVAALPHLQREAVVLFEYERLSLAEVAEVTGTDVSVIKARLSRARERLRRALAPLMGKEVDCK